MDLEVRKLTLFKSEFFNELEILLNFKAAFVVKILD
jgi:hypothetical protein